MRWMIVLLTGCQWVYGVDQVENFNDQPADLVPCSKLKFDPLRYQSTNDALMGYDWATARGNCQYLGLDIAVLDEGDEDEWLHERMGATSPFWLGVQYDTDWIAIDGCTPRFDWTTPPATATAGDCLAETSSNMLDVPCNSTDTTGGRLGVLCEAPRPTVKCLQWAAERNYVVATMQVMDHADAAMACASMQRHLVEIDSTDELDYVLGVAQGASFWVGATKTAELWRSPTGCPQVFGWGPNEPVNQDDCAYFDGALQSIPCSFQTTAAIPICELNDAAPAP